MFVRTALKFWSWDLDVVRMVVVVSFVRKRSDTLAIELDRCRPYLAVDCWPLHLGSFYWRAPITRSMPFPSTCFLTQPAASARLTSPPPGSGLQRFSPPPEPHILDLLLVNRSPRSLSLHEQLRHIASSTISFFFALVLQSSLLDVFAENLCKVSDLGLSFVSGGAGAFLVMDHWNVLGRAGLGVWGHFSMDRIAQVQRPSLKR